MTTTRLREYEVVVAAQEVDAMIVERPGLPKMLALNESSSRDALVRAVRQIAPFADEDEVAALVSVYMPSAPEIADALARTTRAAAPLGPARPRGVVIAATLSIVTMLGCTSLVLAHLNGVTHAVNDLRAATVRLDSTTFAGPTPPHGDEVRTVNAIEYARMRAEIREEVRESLREKMRERAAARAHRHEHRARVHHR